MHRMFSRHVDHPTIPVNHTRGSRSARTKKKKRTLAPRADSQKESAMRIYTLKDSTVREVAQIATRKHRASAHIKDFRRAARTYCGLVLKYYDRTVVQVYVYLRLKQYIAYEEQHGRSVFREHIDARAEYIFLQIEMSILRMLRLGKRIRAKVPRNRYVIMARVGEESRRRCFLICKSSPDGTPYILTIQTAKRFDRCRKRRLRKKQEFRNYHPIRRRSNTIH